MGVDNFDGCYNNRCVLPLPVGVNAGCSCKQGATRAQDILGPRCIPFLQGKKQCRVRKTNHTRHRPTSTEYTPTLYPKYLLLQAQQSIICTVKCGIAVVYGETPPYTGDAVVATPHPCLHFFALPLLYTDFAQKATPILAFQAISGQNSPQTEWRRPQRCGAGASVCFVRRGLLPPLLPVSGTYPSSPELPRPPHKAPPKGWRGTTKSGPGGGPRRCSCRKS